MGTFEAIAISSVADVPEDVQRAYFMSDQGINPFGGIEALLTHAVALLYDVPAAHTRDVRHLRDHDGRRGHLRAAQGGRGGTRSHASTAS